MEERSVEIGRSAIADSPAKRVIDQLRNNIRLVPLDDEKFLSVLHKAVVAGSLTALRDLHQLVWETISGQNFATGNHSDATLAILDVEMTRSRDQLPTVGYLSPTMREYLLSSLVYGMTDYAAARYAEGQKDASRSAAVQGLAAGNSGGYEFPADEDVRAGSFHAPGAAAPAAGAHPAADHRKQRLTGRVMLGAALLGSLLALAMLVTYLAYAGAAAATLQVRVDYDIGAIIGATLGGSGVLIAAITYAMRRVRP
jgi:hypothetical protein